VNHRHHERLDPPALRAEPVRTFPELGERFLHRILRKRGIADNASRERERSRLHPLIQLVESSRVPGLKPRD
jgi:hypothetical protein